MNRSLKKVVTFRNSAQFNTFAENEVENFDGVMIRGSHESSEK